MEQLIHITDSILNGFRFFAIMSSDEFKKGKKIAPLIKDEKGI
jgi:hypothetical protein